MRERGVGELIGAEPALRSEIERLGAVIRHFPWFLQVLPDRGIAAFTLGRRIYVRRTGGQAGPWLASLLRHELEHVEQYRREGIIPFLYQYLREYLILRAEGLEPLEAYRAISFEKEARAAEPGPGDAGVMI